MPVWLIPLIMQLVMNLPGMIHMAEQAFSGQPGSGAKKKDLVLASTTAAMNIVATINKDVLPAPIQTAILGTVGSLADATVSVFNTAGLFQKPPAITTIAA